MLFSTYETEAPWRASHRPHAAGVYIHLTHGDDGSTMLLSPEAATSLHAALSAVLEDLSRTRYRIEDGMHRPFETWKE